MTRDQVFRDPQKYIIDFAFDDAVADVFPDMIRRSVPGYEVVVPTTGLLAARALENCEHRLVYDLGSSLGATSLATLRALDSLFPGNDGLAAQVRIVGVDNSTAMVERARLLIEDERTTFIESDIEALQLKPCGVVLMNFVLQFLPPAVRTTLLRNIREKIDDHGIVIVSEKIRFKDDSEQAFYDAAHLDFKRANDYSDLEISQKRNALENVMIIESTDLHLERFKTAGFGSAQQWFQCLNWASFLVRP
jgi:tRNA (cmo5U34)-methyltransferase